MMSLRNNLITLWCHTGYSSLGSKLWYNRFKTIWFWPKTSVTIVIDVVISLWCDAITWYLEHIRGWAFLLLASGLTLGRVQKIREFFTPNWGLGSLMLSNRPITFGHLPFFSLTCLPQSPSSTCELSYMFFFQWHLVACGWGVSRLLWLKTWPVPPAYPFARILGSACGW